MGKRVAEWWQSLDLGVAGKWFLLSGMVGVIAGLGAIVFQVLCQVVLYLTLELIAGYAPGEAAGEHRFVPGAPHAFSPWLFLLVIVGGGLVAGFLVYTFAPEAEGHGTDAAIDAFHRKRGQIPWRIPIVKLFASAITVGTGGSGGREGPIALIGAGFGSFLGGWLKLGVRDRRILLAAGMGAGIGAIFRAPLAGALFAAEVLYRDADFESDVIMPSAIAATVGYSVFAYSLPPDRRFMPLFGANLHYSIGSLTELLPMTLLAVVLVLVGVLYIKTFYGFTHLFSKLPIKPHFRPAIGAALAGIVGVGLYFAFGSDARVLAVFSTGYGGLQTALENVNSMGVVLLMTIALAKILTTSLTIGSGGSGGVFGPSMVIGGCVGGAVGLIFHRLWPELAPRPEIYTIVGMAGFFSGCAHTPISTIIMVSELTGDYKLLLPTMWVSTICFLLCRRWTLYIKQVASRLDSPAHRGDFIVDILAGLKVSDVPWQQRQTVPESLKLREILHLVAETRQHYFPVINAAGLFVGVFSTDDVRAYLYDETLWPLVVARDIMTSRVVCVAPDDDLNTALKRFTELNLDEVPILDKREPQKLLGMLRRKDTIAAYNRRLVEHKDAGESPSVM